jgi:ActR/RegA family two-component response regulator
MVNQQAHIFVVEDDTEICRLLKLFLETEGFAISFCHHGIEASQTSCYWILCYQGKMAFRYASKYEIFTLALY